MHDVCRCNIQWITLTTLKKKNGCTFNTSCSSAFFWQINCTWSVCYLHSKHRCWKINQERNLKRIINLMCEKITLFTEPLHKHRRRSSYLEECHCGTVLHHPIWDFSLFGQVIGWIYGRFHPLHSEKSSQIGCIGGNDDEGEEPPDASHYSSRQGLGHELWPWGEGGGKNES